MTRLRVLVPVLLSACGVSAPPQVSDENMQVLGAPGEFPSLNELSAPPGAALQALNVVVDLDSYTTHPGVTESADAGSDLTSFTYYKGAIIAHAGTDELLYRLAGGVWTQYAGTYAAPAGELMSFQEANGALFFTTDAGLYRLDSLTSTPVLSGIPAALPGTATLSGASGFLDDGEATAYRWNWAVNVDDGGTGRLVQGAPSPLLVVSNSAGGSRDVALSIPIPDDLPTGAFLQVYRADAVPNTITPTNEVRQVYEREPTPAEVTAATLTFTDSTPDTVKGSGAYYASNTGKGPANGNLQAPLMLGTSLFADSIFGTGVTGVHRLRLDILGTGTTGLQDGQLIEINATDNSWGENYTASAAGEAFPDVFKLFTGGTAAQNLTDTVSSFIRAVNSRSGGELLAFAADEDGTRPGAVILQARTVGGPGFEVFTNGNGQAFAPALREQRSDLVAIERAANVVTVEFATAHPFAIGGGVTLTYDGPADPDFPVGTKTVTGVTATEITYAEVGANAAPSPLTFGYIFDSADAAPQSETGTADNAVAWSERYEPDHWPLTNLNTVGGADDKALWGQPLDRFLFIGSEAGLFRVSGNADEGFDLGEGVWDSSTRFLGRRTVAALDGRCYALASEGLVSWTEGSKPKPMDIPIQDEIRRRVRAFPEVVAEHAFLVADGVNHRLYVAMPTQSSDTAAKVVHVLNVAGGGAWTRLDTTFPGFSTGVTTGAAPDTASGTAYFTQPGSPYLLTTRNTSTAADYQGPAGEAIPASVTFLPLVAGEPARMKQWTWTNIFTRSPTTAIQFCYSTDLNPVQECQSLPSMDPTRTTPIPVSDPVRGLKWPTIVGQSKDRGRALFVKIGHSTAQERFHLLGFEVHHRPVGSGQ